MAGDLAPRAVRGCGARWSRKETGGAPADATPLLPLPLNRPREISFRNPSLPARKTSLRTACLPPWSPTGPLQTAPPASPPTRFALEHGTQRLAAQGTTETPRRGTVRTARQEHVAPRPVAGTQRSVVAFFVQALTLARRGTAAVPCSCAGRRRRRAAVVRPAAERRWPLLPIAACLLLAVVAAVAAGPVLLLGPPTSPALCRLAGTRPSSNDTADARAETTVHSP